MLHVVLHDFYRYPQRAESTPTASHSEDTISSMCSDEEDGDEIVASSDEDEQESPEDYCKGVVLALIAHQIEMFSQLCGFFI